MLDRIIRRSRAALALLMLATVVLAACQPAAPAGETADAAGADGAAASADSTELAVLLPVDFTSFNPNKVTSQPGTNVFQNVLETLVERDRTTPLLAESWAQLDDTTWQFKLREGVSFTNGDAFNAEVAKFSIDRIMRDDNENSAALGLFTDAIAAVDVVDDFTINVVTTRPYPALMDLIVDAYMLPPTEADGEAFNSHGIGTGPYMVESWSPGETMVLVRNPDYWSDAPYFEQVSFRPVPDPGVRTTELRSGGADIITLVPIEELGRLDESGLAAVQVPSTQSMRMHLNAGEAPFDDVRVRQAMNYAIDRATILETLLEGAGQLMNSPSGPDIFGYDPDIAVYPYDPAMAQELLADAGYADGIDIRIQFTEGRYVRDRAIGEAITAQLAEVGIRVEANFSEFSQWLKLFNSDGNGFMVIAQEDNVSTLMAPNFHSQNESFKRYQYGNPDIDALIDQASVTLDTEERRAIYQEANQALHDDAPWVFMWNPVDIYGIVDTITGFDPDGVGFFYIKDLAR